jgi:hypothetical protein
LNLRGRKWHEEELTTQSFIICTGHMFRGVILTKHRAFMLYLRSAYFLFGKSGGKSPFGRLWNDS